MAAKDKTGSRIVYTPPFRMSYPNLLEAKPFKDPRTGKPKGAPTFNVEAIFRAQDSGKFHVIDPDTSEQIADQEITAILKDIANEFWPDAESIKELFGDGAGKWPWMDGDKKAAEAEKKGKNGDHYEGMKVMTFKAAEDYPPRLTCIVKGKSKELKRTDEEAMKQAADMFKAGYYARASVNLKAMEVDGRNYITGYLNTIMFIREGEPLGRGSDADALAGIEGGESDYVPSDDDGDFDI
jgi:hypothetical protein